MATTITSGKDFEIRNITANASTDTEIDFNSRYINSITLRARTSVDLYVRKNALDSDYFTVPAGTSLTLDVSIRRADQALCVRSASGSVVVEVIGMTD